MTTSPVEPILLPRSGLPGVWDRLVGPGATQGENIAILTSALLGGIGVGLLLASRGFSPLLTLIGVLLALDLFGGAVANATETTKRWYHRPGTGPVQHFGFVLPHLLHILVAAWLFRGGDWRFLALASLYLLLCAGLVMATARDLRRPVAVSLYLGAILLWLYLFNPTPGLEWFVPVLFLKLLVGHLVPERPWRAAARA